MKRLTKLVLTLIVLSLAAFLPLNVTAQPDAPAAEQYCTRALDVGGIFCAIGCPNDCSCTFGLYVSQCCCDVAAE